MPSWRTALYHSEDDSLSLPLPCCPYAKFEQALRYCTTRITSAYPAFSQKLSKPTETMGYFQHSSKPYVSSELICFKDFTYVSLVHQRNLFLFPNKSNGIQGRPSSNTNTLNFRVDVIASFVVVYTHRDQRVADEASSNTAPAHHVH